MPPVVHEVVHLGHIRRLEGRTNSRLLDEHRDVLRLVREVRVHLLDGDVADKPRVTAHPAAPDVGHAAAAGHFDQLVAAADDQSWSWFLGHDGASIIA